MDFIKSKIRVLTDKLEQIKTVSKSELNYSFIKCGEYKKNNTPPMLNDDWKKPPELSTFTGVDMHYWIHITISPIKKEAGKEARLLVRTGREGTWNACNPQFIVYINGKTVQALDVNHTWVPLEYEKELDVYIYMYTGMAGGTFLAEFSLISVDNEIEALFYDLFVPYRCMCELGEASYEYIQIRDCLDKALLNLDLRDVYSQQFYNSVYETRNYLKTEFYEKLCGKSEGIISCIGHTHIDVAWLWTVEQTKEKAQRSFATAINMIKRYDDYKFMSSQPQLYSYVKKADPTLYDEIKKAAQNGKWEIEGAMWLESDTNLVSGESLIRQIIFGKRFMKEEFAVESKILWLPDVFGYSGALPQIMKKCNVAQFFTTKMEWNESDKMPNDVFVWEGIDGSKVLAAFEPMYATELNPHFVYDFWNRYKNKSLSNQTILTFGFADGGGGPTFEMMETYERLKYGILGMPKTVIKSAGEFFEETEKSFEKNTSELKQTPKWVGEMYLEMHRGTYTTMARNKKFNRMSENLYMSVENVCTAAMVLCGGIYPEKMIRDNMETILLNQFHDIIPGSSIKEVYDATDKDYKEILKNGNMLKNKGLESIISNLKTDGGIFVYNPSPFDVSDRIEADGKTFYAKNVPAHGWKVIKTDSVKSKVSVLDNSIENDLIKVEFDKNNNIVSVFDKECKREVIAQNALANRLCIYEDYPRAYDAWELTSYYKQKMWTADNIQEVTKLTNGIRIIRKYQKSVITQDIVLKCDSKRIDFITTVDWREDHVILKAEFPVSVRNSVAVYDIQFGNVERPTHRNTSWDQAKFEVCAHKWADLSEGNYGVSLLNDCKYGYSIEDNVMSISLLKAPSYPNEYADREIHTFTYSLYPHDGDFRQGGVVKEGYKLNMPLEAVAVSKNNGFISDSMSLFECRDENIVIETIKKAEDGNSVVIRCYDAHNQKTHTRIKVNFEFKEAFVCNMLEDSIEKLKCFDGYIDVNVNNFEIVTLKFVR